MAAFERTPRQIRVNYLRNEIDELFEKFREELTYSITGGVDIQTLRMVTRAQDETLRRLTEVIEYLGDTD